MAVWHGHADGNGRPGLLAGRGGTYQSMKSILLDGQTAVLRAGGSVWVCVLPDSSHKAELYRKRDFPDGRWQLMAVLETDDAYLVKLASGEDAVWGGSRH